MATIDMQCPMCGEHKMSPLVEPEHRTYVKGVPVVIKNANFLYCSACGEKSVTAREIIRWENLADSNSNSSQDD